MATPSVPSGFFQRPEVGGDKDVWGGILNTNLDVTDQKITDLEASVSAIAGLLFPVGSLYISTSATPPAFIAGATWVAYATGRALVGVGSNGVGIWGAGEERGNETHTLMGSQIPEHSHTLTGNGTVTSGDESQGHVHGLSSGSGASAAVALGGAHGHNSTVSSDTDPVVTANMVRLRGTTDTVNVKAISSVNTGGDHTHDLTGFTATRNQSHTHDVDLSGLSVDVAGGGAPHNNVQPSIGIYVWQRTV